MLALLHCAVARIRHTFSKIQGPAVVRFIEALRYKPEGRGFDYYCVIDINLPYLGSTQLITDMSINGNVYGWQLH